MDPTDEYVIGFAKGHNYPERIGDVMRINRAGMLAHRTELIVATAIPVLALVACVVSWLRGL